MTYGAVAEDGRFRNANDYAVAQGFVSGYPNFHEANYGAGVVHGTMLVHPGSAHWRDVPRAAYNVFALEDVPAMMRGAASHASSQGFRAGMPTFHQADHGAGVVYGTILFGDSVDVRDVRRSEIGVYVIEDVPAMMRAANDYAVGQGYAGGFPTFHQADHGGSTGVVYGIVLHKPGTVTHRDVPADWMALFPRPAEGSLLSEQGRPEVYLIRDGARLHIPNPYVMDALGLDWNAVRTVPQGALDHVPRDESWAPLGGGTPGSCVFVPYDVGWGPNAGKVYWPLRLATTKRHVAWSHEVRTIELRGWIHPAGQNSNDPDISYDLDLDVGWTLGRGIDLSALVKVGNILQLGHPEAGITNPRAWCSTPPIHLEISGFPPKDQRARQHPPDWTFEVPGYVLTDASAGAASGQIVRWPFDPSAPPPSSTAIGGGEYVRVYGSVVSDKPHIDPNDPPKADAVGRWQTGLGNHEHNQARWTEIHPPDWIEVLPARPVDQHLRGVTVVAPGTFTGRPRPTTVLDVDIPAPPRPSADAVLRWREIVGPETLLDTIMEGNAARTGAAITPIAAPDGIRLHVKVGGRKSLLGGSDGKFRALYWLYWERPGPTPPRPPGPPTGPGPHRVTCASKRRVNRLTSIAAVGGLNADGSPWRLSRDEVIAAIDAGTAFYVEGADGRRVNLVVARRLVRRYVKTRGDALRSNNLLRLPDC